MMGPRQVEQSALFYNFSLDAHVPVDNLLRSVDRFVDLSEVRREFVPFYSLRGRPSDNGPLQSASGAACGRQCLWFSGDAQLARLR